LRFADGNINKLFSAATFHPTKPLLLYGNRRQTQVLEFSTGEGQPVKSIGAILNGTTRNSAVRWVARHNVMVDGFYVEFPGPNYHYLYYQLENDRGILIDTLTLTPIAEFATPGDKVWVSPNGKRIYTLDTRTARFFMHELPALTPPTARQLPYEAITKDGKYGFSLIENEDGERSLIILEK
jgi:hypothetical protein